jgi:hypothetical protein
MRNNEFTRRRQEREFQARLFAALQKPKRNKLLAIINSPFFLWLMSLVILTIGGTYVGAYQQCTKEALDQITLDVKIQREYIERRGHILDIIDHDASIAAMRTDLSKPYFYYPEFKDYPLAYVREQYKRARNSIIDTTERSAVQSVHDAGPDLLNSFDRVVLRAKFGDPANGNLADDLQDADIPMLRDFVNQAKKKDMPQLFFFWTLLARTPLQPACTISRLWDRALHGSEAKIVEGPPDLEWSPSPRIITGPL